MKKFIVFMGFVVVLGCAPIAPPPVCTMTWTCGNAACAYAEGAWSGNGSFSGANDESDCLAWETLFLNATGYPYNRVTACSCN